MARKRTRNGSGAQPAHFWGPIPSGEYTAIIVESAWKSNRKRTGNYLELTFEVTEGKSRGARVRAWLNLVNPSSKAMEIARSQLSAICDAVGVSQLDHSSQLHNKPLRISVSRTKREDTGDFANQIHGFAALPAVDSGAEEERPPLV